MNIVMFIQLQEERYGALLYGLDRFFFIVFIFEILLKWYHDFIGFWMVGWNIFDFLVIVGSLFIQSKSNYDSSEPVKGLSENRDS